MVTVGADGPARWFGPELDEDAFLQTRLNEGRVIYEFTPARAYNVL